MTTKTAPKSQKGSRTDSSHSAHVRAIIFYLHLVHVQDIRYIRPRKSHQDPALVPAASVLTHEQTFQRFADDPYGRSVLVARFRRQAPRREQVRLSDAIVQVSDSDVLGVRGV